MGRKVKNKDERLVKLRAEIIKVMKDLNSWVSSDEIQKNLGSCSAEQVGNNLRILKDQGVVANTKVEGQFRWALTGEEFVAQAPVGILIKFPKLIHEGITKIAKQLGQSKNSVVIKACEKFLVQSIDK